MVVMVDRDVNATKRSVGGLQDVFLTGKLRREVYEGKR
jgi:hypothetical protein